MTEEEMRKIRAVKLPAVLPKITLPPTPEGMTYEEWELHHKVKFIQAMMRLAS